MNVYLIIGLIAGLILGGTAGVVFFIYKMDSSVVGTIHVDWTDPMKDIYRIEIDDLEILEHRDVIVLNVERKGVK